jgi:hypothetical protein
MYCVLEDDWLGHKVGSFFSRDDSVGLRDARSRCMACTKGVILWYSCLVIRIMTIIDTNPLGQQVYNHSLFKIGPVG